MSLRDPYHGPAFPIVPASTFSIVVSAFVIVLFTYCLCQYLDVFPLLPLAELFWNLLVYLTPERLISFLHPAYRPLVEDNSSDQASLLSKNRARKSEALRRILGLVGMKIQGTMQGSKSFHNLETMTVNSSKSKGPPGLGNWDNSCYQNSVLQGLASLENLPSYLSQGTTNEEKAFTTSALNDLLGRLNSPLCAGKMFWTPSDLKSMNSFQQQDAQEYYSKILDEVDKEMSHTVVAHLGLDTLAKSKPDTDATQSGTTTLTSRNRLLGLPNELHHLMVRNPLEGLLAQRVGCLQCGYVEGLSLIPFNCLTVPLGRGWLYDVRSCLDEYCNLELINGVECTKCTLIRTKQQLEKLLDQFKEAGTDQGTLPIAMIPKALKETLEERLGNVNDALDDEDFSDTRLKKCEISAKNKVSTTKTRQAVIARAPKSLAIHVNRSLFNEMTGAQTKNSAAVRFPEMLDLSSWCLGSDPLVEDDKPTLERWEGDPATSMLSPEIRDVPPELQKWYRLRAVVTHYGRHENGHYICYRKFTSIDLSANDEQDQSKEAWWRLSDEDVSEVTEDFVLSQGGVFMLFYEISERPPTPKIETHPEEDVQMDESIDAQPDKTFGVPAPDEFVPMLVPATNGISGPDEHEETVAKALSTDMDLATQEDTRASSELPSSLHTTLTASPPQSDTGPSPLVLPAAAGAAEAEPEPAPANSDQVQSLELKPSLDPTIRPEVQPSPEPEPSGPEKFSESETLPEADEEQNAAPKDYPQVAPTMRTAAPRGSVGRSSNSMGQISSMISAN